MSYRTCKKALAAVLALNIALPSIQSVAYAVSPDTRSIDGSQNNITNVNWGKSDSDLLRTPTGSHYGDSIGELAGSDRPNPRAISNAVSAQNATTENTRGLSDYAWAWNQFAEKDMVTLGLPPSAVAEVSKITVPTGDPVFDPTSTGIRKLFFTRSEHNPVTGTGLIAREQENKTTSYLDGSMLYGSDTLSAASARTFAGGKLKTSEEQAAPSPTLGDAVLRWNSVALNAEVVDHTPGAGVSGAGLAVNPGPTRAARALAIVHIAIFDAVNAIDGTYAPYVLKTKAPKGTSLEAAIAQAAHDALVGVYAAQSASFDAALATDLALIPDGQAKTDGIALGHASAAAVIAACDGDGNNINIPYTINPNPGFWRPDPFHPTQMPYGDYYGNVRPMGIKNVNEFLAPTVPGLTSAEYTAAFNEVKSLGSINSLTRTVDQTNVGLFWGYDGSPGLGVPPRLYNQIAQHLATQQGNGEIENARMFALINASMMDGGVAAWKAKYDNNFWRPVTGVREADVGTGPTGLGDGNPDTIGDPSWTPLGAPASNPQLSAHPENPPTDFTPPFPAYTSGHATFGGALFQTMANFFGTDAIPFTFTSDELNGVTKDSHGVTRALAPRSFATLSQAAYENAQSRIYLGIHWSFDRDQGIAQGKKIANEIFSRVAVPERTTDERFAEIRPPLTALQTIFVREHNRFADAYAQTHGGATDEEIFAAARSHTEALIEHITYDEYLPALLGTGSLAGYSGYHTDVDATVDQAFSTAASHLAETMIPSSIKRLQENGSTIAEGDLNTRTAILSPVQSLNEGGIEPILRGLAAQKSEELDARVTDTLRNFLFANAAQGGRDIASLLIQRGRDHGLPSYNQTRRDYGLTAFANFSQITSNPAVASALQTVYGNNIEKVDLWIGGLAEDHLAHSSLGALFTRILISQYERTRDGDRFWYENALSSDDIAQIKATKLSDVIRRNTEIVAIQDNVFFVPGANPDEADLSITQTSSALTVKPAVIALAVTVQNHGPHSGTGIVVTETVPEGLTFTSSGSTANCSQNSNVVTCATLNLGNGETSHLTLHFTVTDALCATNVAIAGAVHGTEADSIQSNNTSSVSTYFACPAETDVQLMPTVSATSSVLRGYTVDVTVGATNAGPAIAQNVRVSMPLPPDFTLQSGSACSQTGANIVCGPFTLAAGQSQTFSLPFDTAPTMTCPSHRQIVATVGSDSHDYYPQDDVSSEHDISVECAPEADLKVTIAGPSTAERGSVILYAVTASNAGPATVPSAVTRLPIETGMTFLAAQSSPECLQNGTDIVCTTSLSPTGTKNFSVAFQSMPTMECSTAVTQHANISTTGIVELNPSDNQASPVTTTLTCTGNGDGSHGGGSGAPSGDADPQNRDRPRTSHSSSHRGSGLTEAMHALEFIAKNHGMTVGFTARHHLVASATTTDVTAEESDAISAHDLEIVCSMKRYLNESPERHTAQKLADWAVDQLSMMLGYNKKLIRAALSDDASCK